VRLDKTSIGAKFPKVMSNKKHLNQVIQTVDQNAESLGRDHPTEDFVTAGAIVVGFDTSDVDKTTQLIECKCVLKGSAETPLGHDPLVELDKWQRQGGTLVGAVFYKATPEGVLTDHELFEDQDDNQWTETLKAQEKKFRKEGEQHFKHLADL
jgi:hypothetical protein